MSERNEGTQPMDGLRYVEYDCAGDLLTIEKIWRSLQETCDHNYFTSWGWISTWLGTLPKSVNVRLVVGYFQDKPLLAFFLGSAKRRKYGVFPTRTIALNATGVRRLDQLYIEYNSMLYSPSLRFDLESLLAHLDDDSWHEFVFPGIPSEFAHQAGLLESGQVSRAGVLMDNASTVYFVDLQKVRAADFDYMKLLSSNKRSQIRRSIKEYEKEGGIQLEAAQTVSQALEMYDALVHLHQQEWERRGERGVFANQYLLEFHKNLIASRFDFGEIQLLKVFTPQAAIGYLYNFVYNRKVLFYQSGLNYRPGNLFRPGLVSHYYAILQNARGDMQVYDFLEGEAAYKSSLSTDTEPMYWMRLVKNGWRLPIEIGVLRLKRLLKSSPILADSLRHLRDRLFAASRPDSS